MRKVRYIKRFDYRPRASVVVARNEGEEVKITEAEYAAASEAGAVELISGESAEQGAASAEAGSAAPEGTAGNRSRN